MKRDIFDGMLSGEEVRRLRIARGWSQADLARACGVNQVTINNVENGITARSRYMPEIEAALGVNFAGNVNKPKTIERHAPVVGRVAAGVWTEHDTSEEYIGIMVPYVIDAYPALEQRAYEVSGRSMDQVPILPGDYVVTVPYFEARREPLAGDIVVVERTRDGGYLERSVKEVAVYPDRIELVPRSSDPRFQEPLVVTRAGPQPDDTTQIEIVGLVVGLFRRMGR
jgi:transcriptional regulator with XRE-family HTH domain